MVNRMNLKKLVGSALVVVGVLGVGAAAYAATATTPAEIVAGLTGQTVEQVAELRATGVTYGTIAAEAEVLPEFQQEMLELKKEILDQRVKDGRLTQEQADEIYQAIKDNQAACNGTGSAGVGQQYGAGFGCGAGVGAGQGLGIGGMRRQGGLGNGTGFGRGRVR